MVLFLVALLDVQAGRQCVLSLGTKYVLPRLVRHAVLPQVAPGSDVLVRKT